MTSLARPGEACWWNHQARPPHYHLDADEAVGAPASRGAC